MQAFLAQGEAWRQALHSTERFGQEDLARSLLIGSGTSYYLAQVVSWIGRDLGLDISAAPSCEVMLYPDHYLRDASQLIIVSRSARTMEALRAGQEARTRGVPTTLVTCNGDSTDMVYRVADRVALSPQGDDGGAVMLRSFTSMLMILLGVLQPGKREAMQRAALEVDAFAVTALDYFRQVIGNAPPRRVVFLGGGALYAVAREAALKVTEMAVTVAESFHPLEYRHGPIATLDPGDAVVMFVQSEVWQDENPLLEVASKFGAHVIAVSTSEIMGTSCLKLPESLASAAFPAVATVASQALAIAIAEAKDIDCDRPRHLRSDAGMPEETK